MRARHWPAEVAGMFSRLHGFLFNKWYFDELYNKIGVKPSFALGRFFWKSGDGATIDGLGPDGVSKLVGSAATQSRKVQSGFIYHYAFAMLIGVVAIVTFFIYKALG